MSRLPVRCGRVVYMKSGKSQQIVDRLNVSADGIGIRRRRYFLEWHRLDHVHATPAAVPGPAEHWPILGFCVLDEIGPWGLAARAVVAELPQHATPSRRCQFVEVGGGHLPLPRQREGLRIDVRRE